jgi:hypothetical protein
MWPVVPRENGQRLTMGLTCGSRLSEEKKGERGVPRVGWLRWAGLGRPSWLPVPFFLLIVYSFYFLFSTKPFKQGSKLAELKFNFFVNKSS